MSACQVELVTRDELVLVDCLRAGRDRGADHASGRLRRGIVGEPRERDVLHLGACDALRPALVVLRRRQLVALLPGLDCPAGTAGRNIGRRGFSGPLLLETKIGAHLLLMPTGCEIDTLILDRLPRHAAGNDAVTQAVELVL